MTELIHNPVFWVAIAFGIFLAGMFWLKVPGKLAASLDDRAAKIRQELDEARVLKEETKALLAKIQRKHHDAEKEAEAMIAQSKEEAGLFAKEAESNLKSYFERQERAVEEKIALAGAEAVKQVQAAAIDVAVKAASEILAEKTGGEAEKDMTDQAIGELKKNLH